MKYLPYIIVLATVVILYFVFDTLLTFRKRTKKIAQQQKEKFYTTQENFEIIYEDSPDRGSLSMWLSDDTILYGRPDLVLKNKVSREIIVVDYKSGTKKPIIPLEYQVQLASYFLLIENEFNKRPTKGIIRYLEDNSEDIMENDAFYTSQISQEAL